MKKTMAVSFSGGRTSAYMCWWLISNYSDKYNFIFIFANTGLEHEKTLEFVNKCDKEFGLNLIWVEAVAHEGRKGCTHKIVNFETASRNGEPFEGVIKKYGIPNQDYPHCNRELKLNPMNSYLRESFKDRPVFAIGIRADELDRINPEYDSKKLVYPLAFWHPTTKEEVRHWCKDQDFDLEIPEHMGNCVTCWKKSDRKLMTVAKHEPERFDFFARMEKLYSLNGSPIYKEIKKPTGKIIWSKISACNHYDDCEDNYDGDYEGIGCPNCDVTIFKPEDEMVVVDRVQVPRKFFRKHKTTSDIIASSKQPFVEFVDYMPELQLGLLNDLDMSGGCSESCDVFSD